MTVTKGTYYKAMLLLIVFSSGTVVSFACSLGGIFHEYHHQSSATEQTKHSDDAAHKHHHGKTSKHEYDTQARAESKNYCCTDSVVEMQKLDKSVSRSIEAPNLISIPFFIAACCELFSLEVQDRPVYQNYVRWRPPTTIQDLRIVIQSFQI